MDGFINQLHVLKANVPKGRYGTKQELKNLLYKFVGILNDFGNESEDCRNATTNLDEEATEIDLMIEGVADNVTSHNEIAYFKRACSELEIIIDALISKILHLEK